MKKAIVTINLGKRHQTLWEKICKPNWNVYATKYGIDIINLTQPLDNSERALTRSPSWQKCLILSQDVVKDYDQIAWIDSDIIINNNKAPNIFESVPIEKIGGIEDWAFPTKELYKQAMETSYKIHPGIIEETTVSDYYKNFGLPDAFDKVMQGGVFVASPKYHRELLEKVYYNYEDKGASYWHYEMRPLSYEIQKAGVITWVSPRFNYLWGIHKLIEYPGLVAKTGSNSTLVFKLVRRLFFETGINLLPSYIKKIEKHFDQSYFFHFAGSYSDMLFMRGK